MFREHRPQYFKDIIIKQTFDNNLQLPILYARSNNEWYINKNNEYYKINDSRISSDYDAEDLDEIVVDLKENVVRNNFEIYAEYEDGLDLSNFLAGSDEPEGSDTEDTTTSVSTTIKIPDISGNIGFTTYNPGQALVSSYWTDLTTSTAVTTGESQTSDLVDRVSALETALREYHIPYVWNTGNNNEEQNNTESSE